MLKQPVRYLMMTAVLAASLFMAGGQALAHKFIVTAWAEEGSVFLEAGFSNGDMAHGADIIVFDDADNRLLTAKTDDQGTASFKIPKKTELKIIVNAGMGHQDEATVSLDEIEEAFAVDAAPAAETATAGTETVSSKPQAAAYAQPAAIAGVSAEEIQRIVDKSLDKKLKPLMRKLSEKNDSSPSFNDIIGGIGYILGLVGLGTYFNYRRKKQGA
ncbi:MAG: hypothetical protein MI862_16070 [Desulfobacterales bacterium]|nr:hypothetical protein [Desulfobacterales bacterium]